MTKKIALVFPGQGSQSVGMLAEFVKEFPETSATFSAASDILHYDLWNLIQTNPEDKLNQTEYAQPALLTASVAIWRVWLEHNGTKPLFLAGHSLGEYSALVCADALTFSDAVSLVADRGRYMQQAFTGQGAMVAIVGLDNEQINGICDKAREGEVLVPANYNSIGQTVLSGELNAANRAAVLAKAAGAKIAKLLPVSVPSHCPLMQPAAKLLADRLQKIIIKPPQIPVIHNADVCAYAEPEKIRDALVRQLYSPVRWVETVQFLLKNGVESILECGPGKVLTGLNRRIDAAVNLEYLGVPTNFNLALLK
ncbi:MAG: ACP S-malonyltransferase [Gammaproteobacteria bacterium]|nr:ACP S-malonyltransferase [Gammaproteobacteria bacterium]